MNTITYRAGRQGSLSLSFAILSVDGEIKSEEPISNELCEALIQQRIDIRQALDAAEIKANRTMFTLAPEDGLGAIMNHLSRALGYNYFDEPSPHPCEEYVAWANDTIRSLMQGNQSLIEMNIALMGESDHTPGIAP